MQSTPRLHGKTALITGASRGIGRAIALGYAAEGAKVVVNYRSGAQQAMEVIEAIKSSGGEAVAVQADVGDLAQHQTLMQSTLDAFGALDILVNNAGIEARKPFLQATPELWERVLDVNLKGIYFLSQSAARVMVQNPIGGKIINISSTHETRPLANASIYNISKGGLMMLTRSLAQELAPHRITVNALLPGAIRTDINREVLSDADYEARVLSKIPLGRIAQPDELIGAALLLAGQESDYMTGASITLDGGLSL